jgi:hypothetical protein
VGRVAVSGAWLYQARGRLTRACGSRAARPRPSRAALRRRHAAVQLRRARLQRLVLAPQRRAAARAVRLEGALPASLALVSSACREPPCMGWPSRRWLLRPHEAAVKPSRGSARRKFYRAYGFLYSDYEVRRARLAKGTAWAHEEWLAAATREVTLHCRHAAPSPKPAPAARMCMSLLAVAVAVAADSLTARARERLGASVGKQSA